MKILIVVFSVGEARQCVSFNEEAVTEASKMPKLHGWLI
jgi:hypothetical protein